VTAADLPALSAWDAPIFGATRREILAYLLGAAPAAAWVALRHEQVVGFVLGRPGSRFAQVGPLIADDGRVALALLDQALAAWGPQAVIVDALSQRGQLLQALAARGFHEQRPFIRMVRGGQPPFGLPDKQFAIAGPELA